MNQCIHNIDLLRWMMGDEVVEVMGMTDQLHHPYLECEDMGIALVRFKNGSYGIIEGTTDVYPKNLEETLYLFGEKGTVKAGGTSVNKIEAWQFADGKDEEAKVIEEFHENPPYVNAEAGKRALEMVLAIYKSAADGKAVKLPLKDVSTMDFVGRFGDKQDFGGKQ